jgi:hypothetical protein
MEYKLGKIAKILKCPQNQVKSQSLFVDSINKIMSMEQIF